MNDSTKPVIERHCVGQSPPPKLIDSANLFDGKREVVIIHQGEAYRLRITRQDKLILTK